jgi:flagellar basal-body rod protein FlgG
MIRSLYTAATGMNAQQQNIDNISNNMSNVNTTAFKKSTIQFQDLMYQTIKEAGSYTTSETKRPVELTIGVGVKSVATQKSFRQGNVNNTGNPLDMAIHGDGFFKVVRGDGEMAYTRDGAFKMDDSGQLVTSNGYYLDPGITIPSDTESINITSDGIILAKLHGEVEAQQLGQVELARFINPAGLKSVGGNLYEQTESSGEALLGNPATGSFGSVEQGYLEGSNVELVDEMVKMIVAQRAYELNSKVVKTSETMLETATNLKR